MRSGALAIVALAGCGGGGGSGDDTGPDAATTISVVRGVPGVWRHDPIQFSLSPAVQTDTLTSETVAVTSSGVPIASELTATQRDGYTEVVITPDWGMPELVAPANFTIDLSSAITGLNGERFDGDSLSLAYPAWPDTQIATAAGRSPSSIAMGADGTAYVAYVSGDRTMPNAARVSVDLRSPGGDWNTGVGEVLDGYAWGDVGIVIDSQGRTVLAWIDANSPNGINATLHVRREYDMLTGTLDILPTIIPITRIRLLESAGSLIVAWSVQGTIRVARWSDVTSEWTRIAEITPISGASDFDVAFDGSTVVLAYVKGANPDGIHIAKQLTYSTWSEATPQFRAIASAALEPSLTVVGGVAHLAWRQGRGSQSDAITARIDLSTMAVTGVAGQLEEVADDDIGSIDVVTSPGGQVYAAFTQAGALTFLRATALGWETLGAGIATGTVTAAVTFDAHGHPVIAHGGDWLSPRELGVAYGNNVSSP